MFLVEKKGNKKEYETVDTLYKHTAHENTSRDALKRISYETATGNLIRPMDVG